MYAVKHKETKKFFAGFKGMRATWVADIKKAKAMTARDARGQALCFLAGGPDGKGSINVQQKPVRIPA